MTTLKPGVDVSILRCPKTGESLSFDSALGAEGAFVSPSGATYPIIDRVPRFVGSEAYADTFGVEWNRFPQTQLDRANGTHISEHRFWQVTGMKPSELQGKRVLEAGCGMGRFVDVLASAGAEVWGADLSAAVVPCERNTRERPNCQIVQADLRELPFGQAFDFIYSIGVLHHTPDAQASFLRIARHLKPGGTICAWVYSLGEASGVRTRWIPRPHHAYGLLTRGVPKHLHDPFFTAYAKLALRARKLPVPRVVWDVLLPIQDLEAKKPMQDGHEPDGGDAAARERLRFDWGLLSVYDTFTPKYIRQTSQAEVIDWAEGAGLVDVRPGPIRSTVIARRPD